MTSVTLAASSTQTASGTGSSVDLTSPYSAVWVRLQVTAVSGSSPTLQLIVEHSSDNSFFRTHTTQTAINTTGVTEFAAAGLDRYIRVRWVVGGSTPSFTFSVSGTSEIVYCTPTDLVTFVAPSAAWGTITATEKADAILSATAMVNSYLQARYDLPVSAWGRDIRRAAAILAGYDLLLTRSLFRDDTQRANLQLQYEQVIKWLEAVRDGQATPDGLVDNTPTVTNGSSILYTRTKRGWGTR